MTQRSSRDGARLEAVERWHTLQLEEAQAEHAELAKAAASKHEHVDLLSQALDSAHLHAREQLQRAILSVDDLRRHSAFAAHQTVEIANARTEMDQAEKAAADAQLVVREQFQKVSVMEKLLERKAAEGVRLMLQAEQKRLDDDALLRVTPKTSETEEQE